MSIVTKTGDNGTTGLLYGLRVSKSDKRINAVGDIDELNAAIGLIKTPLRKTVMSSYYMSVLEAIQRTLTHFMGEVVTEGVKRKNYIENFSCVTEHDLRSLETEITKLEADPCTKQKDWIMYGQSEIGAFCDFASKVCRRAERTFAILKEEVQLADPEEHYRNILSQYINRLSDFLHLLARYYDDFSKKQETQK
jgi:cob(I)alamin adenosyltransferase